MAKREAALSGGDGGIVSIATCKDSGHKRIELSVIASVSEAIERHGIPKKSVRKAMAKPQHSRALDTAIFDSPLLIHAIFPTTAHTSMFSF